MKINSLKELKQFIALCRKSGIDYVKVDDMEFRLAPITKRSKKSANYDNLVADPLAKINVPKPNIEDKLPTPANQAQEIANQVANEGLSPEQLLFYSVTDNPQ